LEKVVVAILYLSEAGSVNSNFYGN